MSEACCILLGATRASGSEPIGTRRTGLTAFEHTFDHGCMTIADLDRGKAATIEALRSRMRGMETTAVETVGLPTPSALRRVLPSLRIGGVHAVDSRSLALRMLAAAIPSGGWSAIVGLADVGVEAAADAGVPVERVVLVPQPGEAWASAVAGFAEVLPVVLAAAPPRLAPAEAARLAARVRGADGCLLVLGDWPQPASRIRTLGTAWGGVDDGLGRIRTARLELEVTADDRVPRRAIVELGGER